MIKFYLAKVQLLLCKALRFSFEIQEIHSRKPVSIAGRAYKKNVYREAQKNHKHKSSVLVNKCHE